MMKKTFLILCATVALGGLSISDVQAKKKNPKPAWCTCWQGCSKDSSKYKDAYDKSGYYATAYEWCMKAECHKHQEPADC